MADLPNLNEATVLYNLQDRYAANLIHTYSGLFVVIINPFKKLPIYTDDVIASYKNQRRADRPPHIFAVADQAYRDMLSDKEDQSIMCTGESGAGKTENTKKVIQYLAHVAGQKDGHRSGTTKNSASKVAANRRATMGVGIGNAGDGNRGELEVQLLKANPVLETFGNAGTCRNDNSSRFGKFIKVHFSADGFIIGASIDTYLLEKSRVVFQNEGERAFHAPYQLLAGADAALASEFLLESSITNYNFITTDRDELDEMDDEGEFKATNDAFRLYGLSDSEIHNIWRIIAGVLTFGQLKFEPGKRGDDQAFLSNDTVAQKVASLFGINAVDLTRCLTKPKIRAGTEMVSRAQTKEQVDSAVKALAKSTYEKLFHWVVKRINSSLDKTKGRGGKQFIGILDIAGFEIFESNSFEQLLINFTNEKLQQLFNRRMFVIEQEEYIREGIKWDMIDFGLDLQPTIDLIEGNQGILPCLDEQSIFPKATDKTLVDKYEQTFAKDKSNCFIKSTLKMKGDFAIKHYAGTVVYTASEWLVKNKDPLNDNVVELLKASTNSFMKEIWSTNVVTNSSARQRGTMRTVAGIYVAQLKELMETLNSTTPHFVRCIKPNHEKKAGKINTQLIIDQLQCGGVLEGIRIVRKGFPNRVLFQEFRQRYQILTPGAIPSGFVDSAKAAEYMVDALELADDEYRLGHTKIFFRTGVLSRLEEERDAKLSVMIVGLQAYARGKLAQLAFKFHVGDHQAVGIIQRNVRAYLTLRKWPWWRLYCKLKPMLKQLQEKQETAVLEDELNALREQLAVEVAARKVASEKNEQLAEEMEKLKEDLEFEREGTAQLEASIQAKERKLKEWEEEVELSDLKIDELMEAQVKMAQENKELASEIVVLKADLAQGNADQARIDRLEKEKTELQESLNEVEDTLAEKVKRIKTIEASGKEMNARVIELESALGKAEKAKSKAIREVDDLVTQIGDVTAQLAAANKKAKQHAAQLASETARAADITAKLDATSVTVHKTQTRVIDLEEQLETATEKLEQAERTNKQLKNDLEELSATDDLEAKVNNLQEQLRTKNLELDEANEELDEKTSELMIVGREKDALEVKMHQLAAQKEDEDAASAPKIRKLTQQLAELTEDADAQSARNSKLFGDKKKLESELAAIRADLAQEETLREKGARMIRQLEKKVAFLSAERSLSSKPEMIR